MSRENVFGNGSVQLYKNCGGKRAEDVKQIRPTFGPHRLVTPHPPPSSALSPQSFEQDGRSKDRDPGQIQKAASAIISALSKRHNSTVMLAVVEVKVETQVESPPDGESHNIN